jgi:hypothetical protein
VVFLNDESPCFVLTGLYSFCPVHSIKTRDFSESNTTVFSHALSINMYPLCCYKIDKSICAIEIRHALSSNILNMFRFVLLY